MNTTNTVTQEQVEIPVPEARPGGALQVAQQRDVVVTTPSPFERMLQAQAAGIPLEQVREMMAIQKEWEKGEALKAFNRAFAAFKGENVSILKRTERADGPLAGRKYANLADILTVVTEPLAKHGLSVTWRPTMQERDWIEIECVVKHNLGHSETTRFGGPPDGNAGGKNPLQSRASAVTYLARYTVKLALGLAEEDDDDDGAGGRGAGAPITDEQRAKHAAWLEKIHATTTDHDARKVWAHCNADTLDDSQMHQSLYNAAQAHRNALKKGANHAA